MKVVKNVSYGAFNLSNAALNRLSDLTGETPVQCKERFVWSVPTKELRSNPALIQVVEELGDAANTRHSCLKVVEIPDDVDVVFIEYDGMENIVEKGRVW